MTLLDLESLVLELPDLPLAAPVERPGLASWRAASMQVLDGLLLRFSEGYTRQNNCANACMAGLWLWRTGSPAAKRHTRHAVRPIFRLIGAWPQPALDASLDGQGYAPADVTPGCRLMPASACSQVSGAPPWQRDRRLRILRALRAERLLCRPGSPEQPLACSLGVIEGSLPVLFDIVAPPDRRGQGHAPG